MDEYKTVLNNVLRLNRIAFRRVLLLTHDILILRTNGVQSKLPKTSSSKCAYTCIQTFNMSVIVVIAFIALTCEGSSINTCHHYTQHLQRTIYV